MTKTYRARPGIHSLGRHFFVILPPVLLHKVPINKVTTGNIGIYAWVKFQYEQGFFYLAVVVSFSGRENFKIIPVYSG